MSGELMRAVLGNLDLDAIDFPFKARTAVCLALIAEHACWQTGRHAYY